MAKRIQPQRCCTATTGARMTNRTLIQFFHWYTPADGSLWRQAGEEARRLSEMGITDIWLPPATKGASGRHSVGYDAYDLFDLGEFDQKGSVATKYGTRDELVAAASALADCGIGTIVDVVFNHKMGADEREPVTVRRANPDDRTEIEEQSFKAHAWTRFTFPARGGKYSPYIWDAHCFGGVDHVEDPDAEGIFKLQNEHDLGAWSAEVDDELGNFDYLMGADVEFRNPSVQEELKFWGRWIAEQLPVAGFRLDAAKHIPAWFFRDWVGHIRDTVNADALVIAEYWHPDQEALKAYLEKVDHQLMLFDVGLQHSFHHASRAGAEFDLRTIFDGSLVSAMPDHAVTMIGNHDTQPLQSLETPVEPWFKPLAYALVLLREQGLPCVFHADLYGADYRDVGGDRNEHDINLPAIGCLPALLEARRQFAHGPQTELIDEDSSCIGFVRHGTAEQPGCVVVLANGSDNGKEVALGPDLGARTYRDWLAHRQDTVSTDERGHAHFPVNGGSVSVWVLMD
ncbi:MAG: alpha-amylase [Novosphingobium sp.]|uniref:alpha-amylase n=1 Tax=Novosphingobium sp. TaxID=1874826 RepID=UPI0027362FC4|nr:alpha-amylase [Novosphingobium sp.]MDP3551097.1 alpha-amylase [Novosphingobium sp.]